MEFAKDGKVLLTLSSKEISYNHQEFPHDTAKQAANRIFPILKGSLLYGLTKEKDVGVGLKAHGEYPEREIIFTTQEIKHNYDVSTWTWWLLHHLEVLIKKDF